MVDKIDLHSTSASSDISESLRDQILGRVSGRRRHFRPTTKTNYRNPASKTISGGTLRETPAEDSLKAASNTKSANNKSDASVKPETSKSDTASMKHYTTIKTQTIAIQTVEPGADGDVDVVYNEETECRCKECNFRTCENISNNKNLSGSDETDSTYEHYGDYAESSCQTIEPPRHKCCCKCRMYWDRFPMQSSMTDLSACSDDSYTTDFFNLPYQNNEKYLRLLRELERKLLARNRDRVKKTMMEFERRSRQNKNLDKPICDYGDNTVLRKLNIKHTKQKEAVCCKCGRNKRANSDILQNEKRWDEMKAQDNDGPCISTGKTERSLHKSHWQLDPRTGEWIKVPAFPQNEFPEPPPRGARKTSPTKAHKKECYCRQRKRHH